MEQMMNQNMNDGSMMESANTGATKKGKGMMFGMIACATLAVAGIGFGVYEMTQANSAKQQISDLKVEIKNTDGSTTTLETDKIEVKEEDKTVVITDTPTIQLGSIMDTENIHYTLTSNIKTSIWDGTTNVPYRITAKVSNGAFDSCKVYAENDGSEVKDCDLAVHNGQIVDIIGGPTGNGNGKDYGLYVLTDKGEVEFINASGVNTSPDSIGNMSKIGLPKRAVRLWGDGKVGGRGIMENGELHPTGGGYYNLVQFEDGTVESIFKYLPEN